MFKTIAIALGLSTTEIGVILFAGVGFLIMFFIGSAKGGYKELMETTLKNDELRRARK